MMIAIIGVPMVENNLTSVDDQKLCGNNLIFINVLFMLKTDMCFLSGILLAKSCKLSSVRLEVFKDCVRLK